jgi:hypothetical protein
MRDPEDAARWYLKAADQGFAVAQNALGVAYARGDGVKESKTEAVRWFRQAAEQGNVDAQYNLGLTYVNGDGVARDYVQAYLWWDLAAAQGSSDARHGQSSIIGQMTREQIAEAQRRARAFQPHTAMPDGQKE